MFYSPPPLRYPSSNLFVCFLYYIDTPCWSANLQLLCPYQSDFIMSTIHIPWISFLGAQACSLCSMALHNLLACEFILSTLEAKMITFLLLKGEEYRHLTSNFERFHIVSTFHWHSPVFYFLTRLINYHSSYDSLLCQYSSLLKS